MLLLAAAGGGGGAAASAAALPLCLPQHSGIREQRCRSLDVPFPFRCCGLTQWQNGFLLAKLTRPPSRVRRLSSFSIVIEALSRFAQWPLTNGPPMLLLR